MKELESIKTEVSDYYNIANSSAGTATPSSEKISSTTSLINKFFPVYDIIIGETTLSALRSLGYNIKTDKDGDSHADVHDLNVWDFNHDKIIDFISINCHEEMPVKWIDLGLSWDKSYNQVLARLKELGFKVEVKESPTTKTYSGRNTLSAKIRATSSNGQFVVDVSFNYGNRNGEGYTTNSPNTLYDMIFRARK